MYLNEMCLRVHFIEGFVHVFVVHVFVCTIRVYYTEVLTIVV